jgi:hypothetical protein
MREPVARISPTSRRIQIHHSIVLLEIKTSNLPNIRVSQNAFLAH